MNVLLYAALAYWAVAMVVFFAVLVMELRDRRGSWGALDSAGATAVDVAMFNSLMWFPVLVILIVWGIEELRNRPRV